MALLLGRAIGDQAANELNGSLLPTQPIAVTRQTLCVFSIFIKSHRAHPPNDLVVLLSARSAGPTDSG